MKKYREKEASVEAEQWFKVTYDRPGSLYVRPVYHLDIEFYKSPDDAPGDCVCRSCGKLFREHGMSQGTGKMVCPGCFVLSFPKDRREIWPEKLFNKTFEEIK